MGALYDGVKPLLDRAEAFIEAFVRFVQKYSDGSWKMHCQDLRALSVYLALNLNRLRQNQPPNPRSKYRSNTFSGFLSAVPALPPFRVSLQKRWVPVLGSWNLTNGS